MDKLLENKYCLLLKTGDAELKALDNLLIEYNSIFPIIELTRGRKSAKDKIGTIDKRLAKIKSIFEGKNICLDLTTANDLSNEEIDNLFDPDDGYKNWINFLIDLNDEDIFKSITPTILVDTNDDNFKDNLIKQVKLLSKNFNSLAYRNDITDDGCYDDIELISGYLEPNNTQLFFIIDCEYILPGSWRQYADKASKRIQKISKIATNIEFILISTSYPKYVTDISGEDTDTFRIHELDLFNEVSKSVKNIHYGDYASINPIRNDQVIMSRGWVPRIDVPLKDEIFYYKMRREETEEYAEVYEYLASNYVIVDKRFPRSLRKNWGIEQIKLCADGFAPGASPSFWIAVRMNIHIEQQLRRLGLL